MTLAAPVRILFLHCHLRTNSSGKEEIMAILFFQKTEANIDPNQGPLCLYYIPLGLQFTYK